NGVRVWDLTDLDAEPRILRQDTSVVALAISPDSRWLATGGADGTTWLWDCPSRDTSPSRLVGHTDAVTIVAFSPDGHWLLTGGKDSTVRLWTLSLNELVARARRTVGRNFTFAEWQRYFVGQRYRKTFPNLAVGRDVPADPRDTERRTP